MIEPMSHPDAEPQIICGYCNHRADQHSLGFCQLCQEDCIAKWYKARPVWAMVKDWKPIPKARANLERSK